MAGQWRPAFWASRRRRKELLVLGFGDCGALAAAAAYFDAMAVLRGYVLQVQLLL